MNATFLRPSSFFGAVMSGMLAVLSGCGVSTATTTDDPSINEGRSTSLALASDLADHCTSEEVIRLDRVVEVGSVETHFSYGFRYKAPIVPGAPVIVSLPGGPGGAAMGELPSFVPEGWGYLLTDPRGVGCNTLAELPSKEIASAIFKTEVLADDVIAAIVDRKLEDYVLFGVSYGTLLGTTISHRLEARKLVPPRAVVLEGVLGRAFGTDFVGAEYIRQWDRIRAALPADVLAELDTSAAPFGMPNEEWSRALMAWLPVSPEFVFQRVAALSPQSELTAEQRAEVLASILAAGKANDHDAPGQVELYRQVACREIMDTVPKNDLDVVMVAGRLVRNSAEEGTKCAGLRVETPYDSAKLPFAAKLYDFIGDVDPATPAWQGAYHFEHHTGGPAVRVVSQNGGHNSLRLNQGACSPAVFASIAAGGADLAAVLATCPLPVLVDTK